MCIYRSVVDDFCVQSEGGGDMVVMMRTTAGFNQPERVKSGGVP